MATIRDVAKKAGVSPASVSLVLNNRECRLSASTKRKILRCAKELDYQPRNASHASLPGALPLVNIIVPDVSNLYFSSICRDCQVELQKSGYHATLVGAEEFENPELTYLPIFLKQPLEGVIFISYANIPASAQEQICQKLQEHNIPAVILRQVSSYPNIRSIHFNSFYGGYLATRHLLELGHRSIGCLTGPLDNEVCLERFRGYQKALEEFQVPFCQEFVYEGNYGMDCGYDCLSYMRGKNVTAIFSFNDMMAIGIYKAVRAYGLKVPQDLSVVGYDDIFITEIMEPPLTTISLQPSRIGRQAAQLLLRLIQGDPQAKNIVIEPVLKVRGSTARRVIGD